MRLFIVATVCTYVYTYLKNFGIAMHVFALIIIIMVKFLHQPARIMIIPSDGNSLKLDPY